MMVNNMRIGSILNCSFQKFDHSNQRDVIVKHIPGYLQTASYDLQTTDDVITVKGDLVGASASDLNSQIDSLKSMVRNKLPIWIDASDQYAGLLEFCRITKLSGPTLDSSKGPLVASFSLQAQVLTPWGVTHANPFGTPGIVFRDLSGVQQGNAINPLDASCNFTSSNPGGSMAGGYFSWEFIVDNQNPFTNVTSVLEEIGNSTTNFVTGGIGDTGNATVLTNATNVPNSGYSGSVRGTVTSPSASTSYGFTRDFGSSGINISSYDRIRLWFYCDQAGQNIYSISIMDTSGNWREYHFSLEAANTWMNLVVDVSVYSGQSTSAPNLSSIRYIGVFVNTVTTAPSELSIWICDIRAEVGYINHCEDTSGWAQVDGSGLAFSNDTIIFKNSYSGIGAAQLPANATQETSSLSAVKISGTSLSAGQFSAQFAWPVGGANAPNFTGYDFLLAWMRCDFGGQPVSNALQIIFGCGGYSNAFVSQGFGNLNANQWYRLVIPLRTLSVYSGTPSLANVDRLLFKSNSGAGSAATNIWVDEIALDVGRWANLEFHVPDNMSQSSRAYAQQTVYAYSWDFTTSSYSADVGADAFGNASPNAPFGQNGYVSFCLDGSSLVQITGGSNVWNWTCEQLLTPQFIGQSTLWQNLRLPAGAITPTTTTTYGCNNRGILTIKLPPATSDSATGNYPSDDLNGFQALNKIRVKVQVSVASEDTTHTGF
ncbi:MAG: hypothetical protein ACYCQJ_02595 [Nitrososphaerales archaeon]